MKKLTTSLSLALLGLMSSPVWATAIEGQTVKQATNWTAITMISTLKRSISAGEKSGDFTLMTINA